MKIKLFTTHRCNLACKYCYVEQSPNKEMSIEVAAKSIREGLTYAQDQSFRVDFFGGEPLLRVDFVKSVTRLTKKLADYYSIIPRFILETNGTILTDKIIDFFKKEKFTISVSLDGNHISNDKNRVDHKGNSVYTLVCKNLDVLINNLIETQIIIVIHPMSLKALAQNIINFVEKKISYIVLSPDLSANWTIQSLKDLFNEYELFLNWYKNVQESIQTQFKFIEKKSYRINQINIDPEYTIDFNGNIFLCDRLASTGKPCYAVGNIFESLFPTLTKKLTCDICKVQVACGKYWMKGECRSFLNYSFGTFPALYNLLARELSNKYDIAIKQLCMSPMTEKNLILS